jgi:Zn-dependent protease
MLKNTKNLLAVLLLVVPAVGWADNSATDKEQNAVASGDGLKNFSILNPTKDGLKELALAALVVRPVVNTAIVMPCHELGHAVVAATIPGAVKYVNPFPHMLNRQPVLGRVSLDGNAINAHGARFPRSTIARLSASMLAGPAAGVAAAVALSKFSEHENCPKSASEMLRFASCLAMAGQFKNLIPIEGRDGGNVTKLFTGRSLKNNVRTLLVAEVIDKLCLGYCINRAYPNFFKRDGQKKDEVQA